MGMQKPSFASAMSVTIEQNYTVNALVLRWKCSRCGFESHGDYTHNTVIDRFVKSWLTHCEIEHNETLRTVCPAMVTDTKYGTLNCVAEIAYIGAYKHEHIFKVDK